VGGIVEDLKVGLLGSEEMLGADEGVAGGDVGVAGSVEEEVGFAFFATAAFLEGAEDA